MMPLIVEAACYVSWAAIPFWVQLCGGSPTKMFLSSAATAAIYVAIGVFCDLFFVWVSGLTVFGWEFAHSAIHISNLASFAAILMGAFGLLFWVQGQFGMMSFPRLTKLFFWILILLPLWKGLTHVWLGLISIEHGFEGPYIRHAYALWKFGGLIWFVSTLAGLCLLGIFVWSAILKFRSP